VTARPDDMADLEGPAALVITHLRGGDMDAALDRCGDCRDAARWLAMALAGVIHLSGGDPDDLMAHLIARRMRVALST
jgi:hypothetical protein